MLSVFLDPSVFSIPVEPVVSEIEEFVNAINEISLLDSGELCHVLLSKYTQEALAQTDSYPIYQRLDDLIKEAGIRHIQTYDVMVVADYILKTASIAEEFLKCKEYLTESYYITPNYYLFGRSSRLVSVHDHLLNLMLIHCKEGYPVDDHILFGTKLHGDRELVSIDSLIEAVDPVLSKVSPPCRLSASFYIHKTVNSIFSTIDWLQCLLRHKNVAFLKDLLAVELTNRDPAVCSWSFHPDFTDSFLDIARNESAEFPKRVIRSLLLTIREQQLDKTHHLREGQSGGEPQLRRVKDGSGAWRRDIDYEYHLHYWKNGNEIEFAVVVPHNVFGIPQ